MPPSRNGSGLRFGSGEAESEPALRVPVEEDAGGIGIHANEFLTDSMGAINAAEQPLEFVVGHCLLELRERLPVWRIGEGIADVFGGKSGEAEEEGDGEQEWKAEDHGLDFGLFNTMLARC